jgi:hypothetical protein
VTTDPSSDTVWPAQSLMKSECRQSEGFSTRGSVPSDR